MAVSTPATAFLVEHRIPFRLVEYAYDASAGNLALAAAQAIGLPPESVLKTLMVRVDDTPFCVILPANKTLSMKRVAAVAHGKAATLLDPRKAERLTGYHTGGISPFGQRQRSQTLIDASTMPFDEVAINGGKRGLLVLLAPSAVQTALAAAVADLSS